MTRAEPELKPCPFCGGPAELIGRDEPDAAWHVECGTSAEDTCGAGVSIFGSAEHAIAAWNRRVDPDGAK